MARPVRTRKTLVDDLVTALPRLTRPEVETVVESLFSAGYVDLSDEVPSAFVEVEIRRQTDRPVPGVRP